MSFFNLEKNSLFKLLVFFFFFIYFLIESESESRLVMSNSLWPHGIL